MADMTDKIEKIRSEITRRGLDIDIQVDGGINDSTSALVKKAGANILVSGSYLFKAENMTQAALKIKE
jgi:ribulose-phosphate 3-epimerase